MEEIYTHIENIIKSITEKWNVTYQRYAEDKPEQACIILYSSRDDVYALSGEFESSSMKVEIHVTCNEDLDDIFENINLLKQVVDKFEELDSTVENLEIDWAKHLGAKVRPVQFNGYNLPYCRTVIDFDYSIGNN